MEKGILHSPAVVATLTATKIWLTSYGLYLLLIDTLLFNWVPFTILGILSITAILLKFRISPANPADVDGFFGQQYRPSGVDEPLTSSNLNETPLVIIGHRGTGLDAPENSLSAIRLCKKRGCRAIEFDVSITKDFVPVVFHDDNLMRMTGIDREVKDMTLDELRRLDISVLHPLGDQFRNERVPTFEEAIDLCLSLGVKFIIDLKDDNETVLNAVVKAFQKHQMYSMGVVSSFYAKVIFDVRRQDPKIIGCMACRPGYFRYRRWSPNWENLELHNKSLLRDFVAIICDYLNDWGLNNLYWWFLGLSAILCNKDAISMEETYRWTKKGIHLYVAVVNAPVEKLNFVQHVKVGYLTDTLNDDEVKSLSGVY